MGLFSKELTAEQQTKISLINKIILKLESQEQKEIDRIKPCVEGVDERAKVLWMDLILLHQQAEKVFKSRFFNLNAQFFLRKLTKFLERIQYFRLGNKQLTRKYEGNWSQFFIDYKMDGTWREKEWKEDREEIEGAFGELFGCKMKLNSPKDFLLFLESYDQRIDRFSDILEQETKKLQALLSVTS